MGNQLTTLGQIYPVEYHLADYCNDLTLDASLGSTRFMKVARVKHREAGYCVAKIYAIQDPSLAIDEHRAKVEHIRDTLQKTGQLSSLPFVHCLVNEKCVILLRQFIKYNLYDRLSTRPFLTWIEKRWIAYQLLRCVQSIHKQEIYHGDIKSENVLVTSFLWITLADFACYKPVCLPENNPSDFSYFFDTSRRHCCNMAPERFVEPTAVPNLEPTSQLSENQPTTTWHQLSAQETAGQLTSQMDLFSLGCVMAELFAEDTPNSSIFDLGQILMFKKHQYDPAQFIEQAIGDPRVRQLILNLTDLDPAKRNSASYHLDQLVPSLFPAYFQTLYDYFGKLIPLNSNQRVWHLRRDLDKLLDEIITEDERGLLLPLILATSSLRSLETTDAKICGLDLCIRLVESAPNTMSHYIIDRLLPYMMHLLARGESRVRARCVMSLNSILSHVCQLESSNSNVFVDYIMPILGTLAYDPSSLVRLALASNVSELAETARKLLDPAEAEPESPKLTLLQDVFGSIVSQLLVDPVNNVRRALMKENISKLCDFFGPKRTDQVILSLIITFVNDKSDFRLRAAFFDNISHIGVRLGPYYAPVVKPLIQKGLSDSEEIVIYKCLKAVASMTQDGLLTKDIIYELFQEAVPLLSFPNKWIRNAVINFILILSRADQQGSIDFSRRILPAIKLHLYRDICGGLSDEAALLESLQPPLPRVVIESILSGDGDIDEFFYTIAKRKMARDKKRYRTISETDANDYDALVDGLPGEAIGAGGGRELLLNVDRFNEDKLIDSELILRRIHKNKRTASVRQIEPNISIRRQDAQIADPTSLGAHSMQINQTGSIGTLNNQQHHLSNNLVDSRLVMCSSLGPLERTSRPRGVLLAHLQEHKGAVNRLMVVPGSGHFVSCSQDSTIKFWDTAGVAQRPQVLFRSRQTFIAPDAGGVTSISACPGSDVLLALTELNELHLLQLYSPSSNARLLKSVSFGPVSTPAADLVTETVALSPYIFATCSTASHLRGYDLRMPLSSDVWSMRMKGSDGLITCLDGNEFCIVCGTSSSVISMFDIRFYIRATTMSYPLYQEKMRKRIRRIKLCNDEIYCSLDGNNEVSTWGCESASRTKTLWASPYPCLSSTHSSHHSVLSMLVDANKDSNSVITAGDDMKIRFWDLNNPHRSYVISRPPPNSHHKLAQAAQQIQQQQQQRSRPIGSGAGQHVAGIEALSAAAHQTVYNTKLVDGIQVIQEVDRPVLGSNQTTGVATTTGSGSASESVGQNVGGGGSIHAAAISPLDSLSLSTAHHDSISSLAMINQSNLLLSGSRDGVIKIWR